MSNSKIEVIARKHVNRNYEEVLAGFETAEEAKKWLADRKATNFVYNPQGWVETVDGKVFLHLTEWDSSD